MKAKLITLEEARRLSRKRFLNDTEIIQLVRRFKIKLEWGRFDYKQWGYKKNKHGKFKSGLGWGADMIHYGPFVNRNARTPSAAILAVIRAHFDWRDES